MAQSFVSISPQDVFEHILGFLKPTKEGMGIKAYAAFGRSCKVASEACQTQIEATLEWLEGAHSAQLDELKADGEWEEYQEDVRSGRISLSW